MATLQSAMRLVRLEALVRLRRFGLWPWVALVGWGLFAAGQEPRLLRSFGIHVGWQGTWSGAAILLLALASSGESLLFGDTGSSGWARPPYLRQAVFRHAVLGLILCAVLAATQAVVASLADGFTGQLPTVGQALHSALGFAIAWSPASVACTSFAPRWSRSILAKLVLVGVVGFSLSLSALWFTHPSAFLAVASLLTVMGAACVGAFIAFPAPVIRTPAPHANRHSR